MKVLKYAAIAAMVVFAAGEANAIGCLLLAVNPLQDQPAPVGQALSYTFPADSFGAFQSDGVTWCCDLQADVAYDAYDYDGGNYSPLPGWLSFDAGSRTFTGTPSSGDVGNMDIVVTVSGCGGSTEDIFQMQVSEGGGSGVVGSGTRFLVRKLINDAVLSSSSSGGSSSSSGGSSSGGGTVPEGMAWGWGKWGQLGQGEGIIDDQWTPIPMVLDAMGSSGLQQLSAGWGHSCAVDTAGGGWCWGIGSEGILGNGSDAVRYLPAQIAGGHSFSFVSAGYYQHACGLDTSGIAWCWGSNLNGQLGDGTNNGSWTPVQVSSGATRFSRIATGAGFACALDTTGAAWCWGDNSSGQLGDGTNNPSNLPVTVSGGLTFTSLAAGDSDVCGLTAAGTAWCWGVNQDGQLGNGTNDNSNVPVAVSGGLSFSSLGVGYAHNCGLVAGGAAWCWGDDLSYQLGDNQAAGMSSNVPVAVSGGHSFTAIASGQDGSCGLKADGTAWCWGQNSNGELGKGDADPSGVPMAVSMPVGKTFDMISFGGYHVIVRTP